MQELHPVHSSASPAPLNSKNPLACINPSSTGQVTLQKTQEGSFHHHIHQQVAFSYMKDKRLIRLKNKKAKQGWKLTEQRARTFFSFYDLKCWKAISKLGILSSRTFENGRASAVRYYAEMSMGKPLASIPPLNLSVHNQLFPCHLVNTLKSKPNSKINPILSVTKG